MRRTESGSGSDSPAAEAASAPRRTAGMSLTRRSFGLMLAGVLGFAGLLPARSHDRPAMFIYAGGTEMLAPQCEGKLEVTLSALTFTCPHGSITVPYDQIKRMEFRSGLSKGIRRLKLHWKVRPEGVGRHTKFFTILYGEGKENQAVVLAATPDVMRPYLAEIELKSGHQVEVERHEFD